MGSMAGFGLQLGSGHTVRAVHQFHLDELTGKIAKLFLMLPVEAERMREVDISPKQGIGI